MKTAREVACAILGARADSQGRCVGVVSIDDLTAAIEARDRELVEACAKAIESLINARATTNDLFVVKTCAQAIRALIPKEAPPKDCHCGDWRAVRCPAHGEKDQTARKAAPAVPGEPPACVCPIPRRNACPNCGFDCEMCRRAPRPNLPADPTGAEPQACSNFYGGTHCIFCSRPRAEHEGLHPVQRMADAQAVADAERAGAEPGTGKP